jgi:hypothetical protein
MRMIVNNHELTDFKVEMYVGYEIYLWTATHRLMIMNMAKYIMDVS